MGINSILSKENISDVEKIDTKEINNIAKKISKALSNSFSEHNLKESDLFIAICRLNMYKANISDNAKAKYSYKNSTIYFDKSVDFNHIDTISIHECLHYLQEYRNTYGKVTRMGLFNLKSHTGLALNEAAVQYMASVANHEKEDHVKYYNMEFSTISPNIYPIQSALLNQMMYFTGTYSLCHSTIFSDNIFKNMLTSKMDKKIFSNIENNLDAILEYENSLSRQTQKLANTLNNIQNINKIKKINSVIDDLKTIIQEKTLETQDMIYKNCFQSDFDSIRTLNDCKKFKYSLYNFRPYLIETKRNNNFNEFFENMMHELQIKRKFIKENGEIQVKIENYDIANIEGKTSPLALFKSIIHKIKLLAQEKIREKDF